MTNTARALAPAPGSWTSIGLIYCYGVMTTASLGKVIPVLGDVAANLGATPAHLAWLISLFALMPALLASVAGSIIDRMGAHRALAIAALIGVAVNLAYLLADSYRTFMAIRVVEGLIAVATYSAAPALVMATTSAARRARAMAVWSTYTPVGLSAGLVMSGSFAGTANWRGGYLIHLVLFGVMLAAAALLPRVPPVAAPAARRVRGLFAAWGQPGPLRLSLTFAMLVLIGFGMSNVYPEWYARQHGMDAGRASNILAIFNLAMVPAGFLTGAMLARGWRDSRLLSGLLVLTAVVALPLFKPGVGEIARLTALLAWMLVQGALIAVVIAALPRVVADPRHGAAAAGLLSQLAALVTLVTPPIWQPILHGGWWQGFIAVTAAAALLAWLLFPRRSA